MNELNGMSGWPWNVIIDSFLWGCIVLLVLYEIFRNGEE